MTTDNFCFYLQNRLIQTSQTGGQRYSDTSPFSIPWCYRTFDTISCGQSLKIEYYNFQLNLSCMVEKLKGQKIELLLDGNILKNALIRPKNNITF